MNSSVLAQTVGLLALSNVFMTFAWYAHRPAAVVHRDSP
ncbi:MAG: DMT family protein [Betaproteobacteria bacterium]|nr:MAG: DMT family protein [Betaproteobacteria bacterium]